MNAGSPPTVLHARAEPLGGALRRSQQLFSSFPYFRLFVYAARGVVFGPLGRACGLVGAEQHFILSASRRRLGVRCPEAAEIQRPEQQFFLPAVRTRTSS